MLKRQKQKITLGQKALTYKLRIDPVEVKNLTERIMEITKDDWYRWSNDGKYDALDDEHDAQEVIKLLENFLEKKGILVDYNYN